MTTFAYVWVLHDANTNRARARTNLKLLNDSFGSEIVGIDDA
jgi:hypothetical protein